LSHQQTIMSMSETENITVWLSLANTVFASIVFVLWYFAIWQEEEEKLENDKVFIVDANDSGMCEKDVDNTDTVGEDFQNNDDKHLYVKPSLNYHDYCCYNQNTAKQTKSTDSVKVKHIPINSDTKITWADVVNKTKTIKSDKTTHAKHGDAIFQWPKHENTVEKLRYQQVTSQNILSEDLQEKLKSLGILRDPETREGEGKGSVDVSVRVSDSARMACKLMDKKKLRITWDNFHAKSRPGPDLAKSRKSHNYQKKNKNSKQSSSVKAGELNWRNLPSQNVMDVVRAV